jgi:tRNA 5-methylaminomethyl-2-thiouridine biosynthesis bifunctional protein
MNGLHILNKSAADPRWLAAADLPHAWRGHDAWIVLDLDFGQGEAFAACWQQWRTDPCRPARLFYVALGLTLCSSDAVRASLHWAGLDALTQDALTAQWPWNAPGVYQLNLDRGQVRLSLALGPPAEALPQRVPYANTVLLAYGAHPQPWPAGLIRSACAMVAANGRLVVWPRSSQSDGPCPASLRGQEPWAPIHAAIQSAGFELRDGPRAAGLAPVWVAQRRYGPSPPSTPPDARRRQVLVVGAGLAGSAIAVALARRAWHVHQISASSSLAHAVATQPVLAYHPSITPDDAPLSQLLRHALLWARAQYDPGIVNWHGRIQIETPERAHAAAARMPQDWVRVVSAAEARDRSGLPVRQGGLWIPLAGSVNPTDLCHGWRHPNIVVQNARVTRMVHEPHGWVAYDHEGRSLAEAPMVILATGAAPWPLKMDADGTHHTLFDRFLPGALKAHPGRTALVQMATSGQAPRCVLGVSGVGHAVPCGDNQMVIGPLNEGLHAGSPMAQAQRTLERLCGALGLSLRWDGVQPSPLGTRLTTRDHLPLIGPLTGLAGVWLAMGLGGRGLLWSVLAAELLASELNAEPRPLVRGLRHALLPERLEHPAFRAPPKRA